MKDFFFIGKKKSSENHLEEGTNTNTTSDAMQIVMILQELTTRWIFYSNELRI